LFQKHPKNMQVMDRLVQYIPLYLWVQLFQLHQ
jgi:hypothetical protein